MKKFIFISFLFFTSNLFISCKKEFSCQCVSTFEAPGYYPYTISSNKKVEGVKTIKKAKNVCLYSEKQISKYMEEEIKKPSETHTTSCAIK